MQLFPASAVDHETEKRLLAAGVFGLGFRRATDGNWRPVLKDRELVYLTSSGMNPQGNSWFSYNHGSAYFYQNQNGSVYHKRPDGSEVFIWPNNTRRRDTAPNGMSYITHGDNHGIRVKQVPFWFTIELDQTHCTPNGDVEYVYNCSEGSGQFRVHLDRSIYFESPGGAVFVIPAAVLVGGRALDPDSEWPVDLPRGFPNIVKQIFL